MRNRRVASSLTFIIDLVTFIISARYLLGVTSTCDLSYLRPLSPSPSSIPGRDRAMTEAIMLPTPAASSSTSPAQLDSTDKKRPRESTASSALQTPATKKAKAEATNGAIEAKETKGVFCHQSVQHDIRGREADS